MLRRWLGWVLSFVLAVGLLGGCATAQDGAQVASGEELEAQVLEIIRANPEVILESVQQYQQDQEAAARQERVAQSQEALDQMAADPAGFIGESPVKGSESLEYVLFEFSDFECPFCGRAVPVVDEFLAAHEEVSLTYKHFPLTQIHQQAMPAAMASWAAQQQGEFWAYHDALFANQQRLGEELYEEIATDLELDMEQFAADREAAAAAIEGDMALGASVGLRGTPYFVLNGVPLEGASLAEMERVLAEVKG